MKRSVVIEPPSYAVYEDPRTRYRHQFLLHDYEELQKETEAMKMKLQIMKQKKMVLSAEVRFLRRRYKQLTTNQSQSQHPRKKQEMIQSHSHRCNARPPTIPKSRNYNRKESSQQPPIVAERAYHVLEGKLPKACQLFDLNQNAKNFNGNDASIQNPVSALDLNQKEMIMFIGKEANKRSMAPFFDLNEISREEEEEECHGGFESLNLEEPKRGIQRSASDEQHNDMKMSVCRSAGSGPSRPGKRKISWQDQVALRV